MIPNGGRGDPRGMVEDRGSWGWPFAGQQHAVGTSVQGLDCTWKGRSQEIVE